MDLTCRVLKENGFHDLSSALREAKDDRKKLGRFYIYYAASKRSADLYSFLMGLISGCSEGYKRHPLPLSYRKFHAMTRKMLDRDMARRGWSGSFPCFFIKSKAGKIPVKSVYSKKYDYENEKSYYVDFMESVSDTSYTIMALTGQILRRPDEEASDFCALDCCFLDGGRRESRMFGSITMNGQESAQQVLDAAVLMAERVTKSVRG